MASNLSFITNEKDENLLARFKVLIKDTQFFDALVGYFYTSGFYSLYEFLEKTEKIRILIGISTNIETADLIQEASQLELAFSHTETKTHFSKMIVQEMVRSNDEAQVEKGVYKFLEWLQSGKLEIKAYPTELAL